MTKLTKEQIKRKYDAFDLTLFDAITELENIGVTTDDAYKFLKGTRK